MHAGRGFAALELWCTMPGWAAATEVMHRGKDPAGQANEISHAAVLLADSLSLLTGDVDFSMLHHSVSLAWTVRKLMWPYVQRGCRTSTAESRDAFSDTVGMTSDERPRWADEQAERLDLLTVTTLVRRLSKTLLVLDRLNDDGGRAGLCLRIRRGTSSNINTSTIRVESCSSINSTICARPKINGYFGLSNPDDVHKEVLIHQLQAIILTMLIQICLWLKEPPLISDMWKGISSDWVTSLITACKQLTNPDVRAVVKRLSRRSQKGGPKEQRDVNVMWERYAVAHFHGRMSPGCCNLSCTNLSGFSEAALKTLLCAGCKRARYCSVGCQRVAWEKGGHSSVCGGRTSVR